MEGTVHVIATHYCPLASVDDKLKNQQNFCTKCPRHDKCEKKASKVFEELKEVYLKPYEMVLRVAKESEKIFKQLKQTGTNLQSNLDRNKNDR